MQGEQPCHKGRTSGYQALYFPLGFHQHKDRYPQMSLAALFFTGQQVSLSKRNVVKSWSFKGLLKPIFELPA